MREAPSHTLSAGPRSSSFRSPVLRAMPLLVILAMLLAGRAFWYDFLSDDALIAARYARNVARGHGWVYNVGERVEGYTSVLWVAVAAALGKAGVDFVFAVQAMSLGAALLTLPLLRACAKPLESDGKLVPWISPTLFAACATVACWAWGGLEATGYALSVLLTLYLLAGDGITFRRAFAAGITAGLCGLTRPEGVAVTGVIGFWFLLDAGKGRRHLILAYILPAAIIVGAHLLWRKSYYGFWLPNTYYAKVGSGPAVWQSGYQYVRECMLEHGGLLAWILPIAAPWFAYRNSFARGLSLTTAAMLAGVVLVGGDGLPMHRFLMPAIPMWLLLLQKLLAVMLGWGMAAQASAPRLISRWTAAIAVVVVAFSLMTSTVTSEHYLRYRDQQHREIPDWSAAGRWLNSIASSGQSVACAPIGAVGYYSDLIVLDMLGLTDVHIAHKDIPVTGHWVGHEKHDGPYILSRKPTYLLLGNVQVLDEPLATNSPFFVQPPNDNIKQREQDIFTPELLAEYSPRVARLDNGKYLHLLQRRPDR